MRKQLVTLGLGALAIPLLGGAAYAAAHSISTRPAPQVVVPASPTTSGSRASGHDGTDHGPGTTTSTTVDDRGHDPAGHDAGDDNGVDPTTSTTSTTIDDRGEDPAGDHSGKDASSDSGSVGAGHHEGDG
jgi:hypothetical protein